MEHAYIKDISYYLPKKVVTNEDIIKDFPEWSVEKITSKVGVNKRYVADDDETATDLAVQAAEKLFANNFVIREEIDFILFCTQSPDYHLPTSACLIQTRLGLSNKVGALDFNLGCSGYVYGLSLAKGLIVAKIAKNVLLLTAETYNKYIHPKDKGNKTIFGDGASATVVSDDGFAEIGDFSLGTDGKGAENLIVKTGGAKYPNRLNNFSFDEKNGKPISSDHLFMDGGEIFTFTILKVPKLLKDTMKVNHLEKEDINLFVLHQANKHMLDYLKMKAKIEDERFYYYLSDVGNTVSSSIPIALVEALKDGSIKEKTKVMIAGFGVGYSWAGCVLFFK